MGFVFVGLALQMGFVRIKWQLAQKPG